MDPRASSQLLHSCTRWVTEGCDPCDRLRKQQTKSVAALYLPAGLFILKRRSCSLRKHQNMASLLLQSSLSQFPCFFPLQWKLFPAARGRWWCSTAAVLLRRLYAAPAQQPSKTRLQAKKYVWGGFKEAAGCYARWPRSLWCNYPSQLVFQTCFVKLLRFLLTSSNANNFPLFHHIYHVLNSIRSMQMITEGISVLLASFQHSRKKISM